MKTFVIEDGRDFFYQWDYNQILVLNVESDIDEAHFCPSWSQDTYIRALSFDSGIKKKCVLVPDEIMARPGEFAVYGFNSTTGEQYTKALEYFQVIARPKPTDLPDPPETEWYKISSVIGEFSESVGVFEDQVQKQTMALNKIEEQLDGDVEEDQNRRLDLLEEQLSPNAVYEMEGQLSNFAIPNNAATYAQIEYFGGMTVPSPNLFDKDNAPLIAGAFSTDSTTKITTLIASANARTTYMKCEPNTTYTVFSWGIRASAAALVVGMSEMEPVVGTVIDGRTGGGDYNRVVITTSENAKYLVLYIAGSGFGNQNIQPVLDSIQVSLGRNFLPVCPYYEGDKPTKLKEIKVKGKNLIPYPYIELPPGSRTVNGIDITCYPDGHIRLDGTLTKTFAYRLCSYIPIAANTPITVSGGISSNVLVLVRKFAAGANTDSSFLDDKGQGRTGSFKDGECISYCSLRLQYDATNSVNNEIHATIYPMLNYGKTAEPWEPYYDDNMCNYFNAKNIKNARIQVNEDGSQIIMPIITASSSNGFTSTQATLKELCPELKVGDCVYLEFTRSSDKLNNRIYLNETKFPWTNDRSLVITKEHLDSTVVLYANMAINNDYEQAILSDFRIVKHRYYSFQPYGKKVKTIPIPEEIQNLPAYGHGISIDHFNKVDLENQIYEQNAGDVSNQGFDGSEDWHLFVHALPTNINPERSIFRIKAPLGIPNGALCSSNKFKFDPLSGTEYFDFKEGIYVQLGYLCIATFGQITLTDFKNQLAEWHDSGDPLIVTYNVQTPLPPVMDGFIKPIPGGQLEFVTDTGYPIPMSVKCLLKEA